MAGMATGMATGVLPGVRPGMAAGMATMVRGRADLRPRRTTGACGAFIEPSGHPAVAGNPAVADNYAVAQLCKWNPAVALAASEVQNSVAMPKKGAWTRKFKAAVAAATLFLRRLSAA